MTAKRQELLSAFVDGELNAQELDELLALMNTDDDARSDYLRYQLASDTLRGYSRHREPVDISARLRQALDDEPVHQQTGTRARVLSVPNWFWKQTAGFAAAASIGALAVVGVINQPQSALTPTLAKVEQAPVKTQTTTVAASNRWTVGEQEVEDRLNNYLVDHNEYAGASGLFSYARVVSYGEE